MQARLKIITVLVTMTAMFAMLPALSAVAAEPLDDGAYTVVAGGETLALQVTDGQALVADTPGVEWFFDYNEDGRVLDEFDLVVDGLAYEVEIGEDGTAFVKPHDDDFVPTPPAPEPTLAVEEPDDDEDDEIEAVEEPEDDEAEDDGNGALVSAVAKCAPTGRTAREAGMPNHGEVVSAVAQGTPLTFTVAEVAYTIDGEAGAEAVCATLAEALAAGEAAAEAAAAEEGDEARRGNGNAKAKADDGADDGEGSDGEDAPADEAPGKSGDAPGKGKKGAGD